MQVCSKEFAKKSNRDRHFNLFHVGNNSIEIDDADKSDLDNELPTMVPVMHDDQNVDNFVFLPNIEVDPTPNIEDSNVNEGELVMSMVLRPKMNLNRTLMMLQILICQNLQPKEQRKVQD